MNKNKIVSTRDGSMTVYSELHNAHYHSLNGALQESEHIFINNGFKLIEKQNIKILEVGFGTGLNACLTAYEAAKSNKRIYYHGIDLFPLSSDVLLNLNYPKLFNQDMNNIWTKICFCDWGNLVEIVEGFTLIKDQQDFCSFDPKQCFDIVYFDAFAPEDQPEMWESDRFKMLYRLLNSNGILVTYCSKGVVKQALREAGFNVKRLPGPQGKRHIVRATKY